VITGRHHRTVTADGDVPANLSGSVPGAPPGDGGQTAGVAAEPILVATADPVLADALGRLAAAAAVGVRLLAEPPDVATWQGCDLALVGADVARRMVSGQLPRRGQVVLVTADAEDTDVWQLAVSLGAEQVAVLPDADAWLVDRLAATADPPSRAHVVGVMGGCGGAGASVLAAGLAVAAAEGGYRVLLADLDPLGGGLDLTLGVDVVPGLRWPDLAGARGRLPSSSVHDSLPRLDDLAVLAWGRGAPLEVPTVAVEAVLRCAARSHDLVVLDLPRAGADRLLTAALRDLDELLLVVPARLRAAAAAAQVVERWRGSVSSMGAVVRRGSGERLTARAVADAVQLPMVLKMRDEPRVDALLDRGEPPALRLAGPLRQACDQWVAGHLPSARQVA
jgi:secretion/DNA translocation related CpaE-like protein